MKKWKELAKKELKNKDMESIYFKTEEGITFKPVYTLKDLKKCNHVESMPGISPFTRGIAATMYTNKPWTIRQYAGFSTAEKTNAFYRKCLSLGQEGLSVAFDLPTHRGFDSDHPRVRGDVGKTGVAIDSVEDMKVLFDGIQLEDVSVSMTMNGAVLPVMASYIVAAEESGARKERLSGTIQNDILKEFLVRNTYIYPPKESMRIVSEVMEYTSKHMPKFNSISVSGYHMHEAGATLALELGLTIANGIEYVKTAIERGLDVDSFAPRMSFFFATGMSFYLEIAKLRAARMLWSKAMGAFFPKNIRSTMLRTHSQTSGWSLAAQDPYNNIIRTTIEAMASIFGGTQSLHTNSFDEALGLPTEFSSKIARNTQLLLQEETHITKIVDPFGGSYAIETLTNELFNKAESVISDIEKLGGMTKAISKGIPKMWIEKCAIERQAKIDNKKEVIIGVNKYAPEKQEQIEVLEIDNKEVLEKQLEKLKILKKNRNNNEVKERLQKLKTGSGNLLELTICAMKARATVGEVSSALIEIFGTHSPASIEISNAYSNLYDDKNELADFKKSIDGFSKKTGRRPRLLMAKVGQDGHDRGFKLISSSFADLGFDVDIGPLFQTPEEVVKNAIESDVHAIGISSLAGGHKSLILEIVNCLKKSGALEILIFVGGVIPQQDYKFLEKIGVSGIFGTGTRVLDSAKSILDTISKKQK